MASRVADFGHDARAHQPARLAYPQHLHPGRGGTGSRLVFVAGQEPEDTEGRLVGPGDLAVQARQVFANLGRALTAAGAVPDEVARITIYVVDYNRDEHLPVIEEARVSLFGDHKPADSLIGVDRLSPGYLIEVEAIAVTGG